MTRFLQGSQNYYTPFLLEEDTTVFLQSLARKNSHQSIQLWGLTPWLLVYRLRNNKEVESFLEEVSGSSGKKELLAIYKAATDDEYSFLYVNLAARKASEMFYKNFTGRIELEDEPNDWHIPFFNNNNKKKKKWK